MKNLVKVAFCLVLLSGAVRMGFSRGDKIIPQVVAGGEYVTRFDLTNISSYRAITKMRLAFYYNDGTAWKLQTNQGDATSYTLSLQPRQTLRVETIGGSTIEAGYAVIYDEETGNSEFSEDYVLGISVFYQISSGAGVTESVSIPLREPTAAASVPVEIAAPNVYSAVAIVNAAGISNTIQLKLYEEDGDLYGTRSFTLDAGKQRTAFLDHEEDLFPGLTSFRGMVEITANGPIVFLSLRQTRAVGDKPQFTLLVPVDRESLRRNSYMVLLQANDDANPYMPIDIDGFTSDFYRIIGDERIPSVYTESYSWDLEYRYVAGDTTNRYFRVFNGAKIASLGWQDDGPFDAISLPDLKALSSYSTDDFDLSGLALYLKLTFAIRTDLGHYAKARIIRIVDTTADSKPFEDLVLEVVVYK